MPHGHRQSPFISTSDVQEYLQRQSRLCDSRIEDTFMRLSSRHDRHDSSADFERRTLSSSCTNLPSRKYDVVENVTRPSSAQERRSHREKTTDIPRGILKRAQSPVATSRTGRKHSHESPDEWFQRIMQVKKLSPLDLCEEFSYGNARKHPLVPLSHVCEVLFDLDPESANGSDPVTDDMEEFLYQFATDKSGEIMVNVREALRALDIWQSRVTSSAQSSKMASDPQSKATILESKNRKLKDVISSLQGVNLQLSRQLETAKLALSPKSADESSRLSQSRATTKQSSAEVSPVKFKTTPPTKASGFSASSTQDTFSSSTQLQVVNLHEQELVEIANKLQFTGVKRLETFLIEGDANSTGFINLKQLCWILADQFELQITEVRLVEVCMGMKFNSNAQVDYKEFVDVLMDILIYALPDIRESAKRKSLVLLDQYLQSGFPPRREGVRQLLDALCSKYDLQGDQCISVSEMVRVFHVDLVKHHARELPFPLQEHDTIQLAQPFIHHNVDDNSSTGILCYPELLDTILGPFPSESNTEVAVVKRALKWKFWCNIYMALCAGDARMEQKVLAQLGKILAKLDPGATFTISTRHFKRIFERHISSDDMEELIAALAIQKDTKGTSEDNRDDPRLRYDVLLKLAFGSPELRDEHFFERHVRKKLLREQERLQFFVTDVITTRKPSHRLTIQDFYETFIVQAEEYPLATVEMLFLFGTLDFDHDGSVDVRALQSCLSSTCWKNEKRRESSAISASEVRQSGEEADVESIKKLIANCCYGYDFQRALKDHSRHTQGWISHSVMVKEVEKMLDEMGVVGVHHDDLKNLVRHISQHTTGDAMRASTRDSIHFDAFFDALFDWNSIISSMRLPHSLVEVKKLFETFDSERTGIIRCEDWNKAYRQICRDRQGMTQWEIQVLQRRFPSQTHEREQMIDYAHLIVFLLDYQQRQTRKALQLCVIQHFQQKFTSAHSTMSTTEIERLFRTLDVESKGYFDALDLKAYLTKEFTGENEQELDSNDSMALLTSTDALESVMCILAGDKLNQSRGRYEKASSGSSPVVTFDRFREISTSFTPGNHRSSSRSNSVSSNSQISPSHSSAGSHNDQKVFKVDSTQRQRGKPSEKYPQSSHTISSLRVLEIAILEIANEVADLKGNILPARAFRYFSFGPTDPTDGSRHTPPTSPVRRSSPTNRNVRLSATIRKKQRELEASTLDPLTPARLKQVLQVHHNIELSTHLISQFFLHIGSPSKYFLDLLHFAQWAAPLTVELQLKVRDVVRQIIVKGKGGGGRLDLDRFLAQLQRRLQDSPHYRSITGSQEDPPLQFVSMTLLLSKLHQLNIPLLKQELMELLRHFGMEENLEALDYALFLQRLYELNASMTV